MALILTGASDDLIELDGDLNEEWGCYNAGRQYVAFSDGTLVTIEYDDDGIWRIHLIFGGRATFQKVEGSVEKDTFDVVTLTLPEDKIEWALLGKELVKNK